MNARSHTGPDDVVALILNYRTAAKTISCLAALQAEGVKSALIWDNSADLGASAADIRAMASWSADRLRIVESPRNLGFGTAVNKGLAEIRAWRGKVPVLLVNSDAQAQPGMVAALWQRMLAESSPALIAPLRISPGTRRTAGAMHYHRLTGMILTNPFPGTFLYLNGCCLLIPPALYEEALFDEAFFFYGDDCELSWRLSRKGVTLCIEEDAKISHEGSGSSVHASAFYEYQMVRSHLLMAIKTATSPVERMLILSTKIAFFALRANIRTIRSRNLIPLREYWHALFDHFRGHPASARQPAPPKPR